MNKLFITICAITLFAGTLKGQTIQINNVNTPTLAGERMLTFECPLNGLNPKDVEIYVIYSDNKEDVLTGRGNPQGRATVRIKSNDRSKLSCTFYFPHADHMNPNFITKEELDGTFNLSENDKTEKYKAALALKFANQNYSIFGEFTDKRQKSFNNPDKIYFKVARVGPGGEKRSSIYEFTMPRLFIIGYMGDSYTSGEGAPYSGDDKWDSEICHRSNNSGGMKAITKLKKTHRELGTRVINTTCSGATIRNLTDKPQHEKMAMISNMMQLPPSAKYSQIDEISEWCKAKNRETVDILLMGIGGNTAGLVELATAAIAPPFTNDNNWSDFERLQDETRQKLRRMPEFYKELNEAIESAPFNVGKVLMMNYPNMLHGKDGELCDAKFSSNTSWNCADITLQFYGHINFFKEIFTTLNESIRNACDSNNWELIRVSAINKHGMCNCEEPYFNTWADAVAPWGLGDQQNALHPNKDGYENLYKQNVYNVLVANIKPAQDSAQFKILQEERADLREKLRADQEKKIAREIARTRLKEKLKSQDDNAGENQNRKITINPDKNFEYRNQTNKIPLRTPDEPKNTNE